jgi:hypothetical protein
MKVDSLQSQQEVSVHLGVSTSMDEALQEDTGHQKKTQHAMCSWSTGVRGEKVFQIWTKNTKKYTTAGLAVRNEIEFLYHSQKGSFALSLLDSAAQPFTGLVGGRLGSERVQCIHVRGFHRAAHAAGRSPLGAQLREAVPSSLPLHLIFLSGI